jgi:hypothetical protein
MDPVAQPAVGERSLKRRLSAPTEQASRLTLNAICLQAIRLEVNNAGWDVPRFSAHGAVRPRQRSKRKQARFRHAKSGNAK